MMTDFLAILPQILRTQALAVALAWAADALSWKVRREEVLVGAFNVFGLMLSVFLVATLAENGLSLSYFALALLLPLAWLIVVARVQRRQFNISFRAAFFGALMQLMFFVWALFLVFAILIPSVRFFSGWSFLLFLVTVLATYALLSLFRPAIYSTWKTWRQNSGENRPVR